MSLFSISSFLASGGWRLSALLMLAVAVFAQPLPLQLREGKALRKEAHRRAGVELSPNLEALRAGAAELSVILPEGRRAVLQRTSFEDRGNGDVLWRGRVEGFEGSFVLFTVHGGLMTGHIQTHEDDYSISLRGGTEIMEQLDRKQERTIDHIQPRSTAGVRSGRTTETRAGLTASAPAAGEPQIGDSEIDVMVIYTQGARTLAGGDQAMLATVQGLVDHANTVFINSSVPAHYRLVYAGLALNPNYGDVDYGRNLELMARDSNLTALRNAFGVDLVALLIPGLIVGSGSQRACGVAESTNIYQVPNSFTRNQVTSMAAECGSTGNVYAHENGHLIGLGHDPEFAQARGEETPAIPYARGHQVQGVFSTVMSNTGGGNGVPWLASLSSPEIFYQGIPTGIADQRDNARAARINVPLVAAFRPSGPPPPTAPPAAPAGINAIFQQFQGGGLQVHVVCLASASASSYQFERSTNGAAFSLIGTANTCNFDDATVTTPNTYQYRVNAINFRGSSPYSDVRTVVMPNLPATPSNLIATPQGTNEILLTWTDSSNNEAGFVIEWQVNGQFGEVADAVGPNVTSYVFRFGQAGTAYSFRVYAYTTDELLSGVSNVASATTLSTNPGAVTGFAWNDANNNGKADIGETPAARLVIYYDANANGIAESNETQLSVSGEVRLYPGTNLPYIASPNYRLGNLPFGSRRICASFDATVAGKSFCRTVNILSGGTTQNVNFPVVQGRVGVSTMAPRALTVNALDMTALDITWTHTDGRWTLLKDAIIRFAETETEDAMQIRFEEATRQFSHYREGPNRFGPGSPAGAREHFETNSATLYLEDTEVRGSGPNGPSVTLHLAMRFKPKARGKTFTVQILLTDDNGFVQGFDSIGTVTVR